MSRYLWKWTCLQGWVRLLWPLFITNLPYILTNTMEKNKAGGKIENATQRKEQSSFGRNAFGMFKEQWGGTVAEIAWPGEKQK